MRARVGWLMFVIVVSVVTISARARNEAKGCHFRDGGDHAAAEGLAPALIGARTVFLISEVTPADNGRSVGELRHELHRWHRWEEVSRRDAADVTLSITMIRGESGRATLTLGIRAQATGAVLWTSDGRDVSAALKSLEDQLPSDSPCAPVRVL